MIESKPPALRTECGFAVSLLNIASSLVFQHISHHQASFPRKWESRPVDTETYRGKGFPKFYILGSRLYGDDGVRQTLYQKLDKLAIKDSDRLKLQEAVSDGLKLLHQYDGRLFLPRFALNAPCDRAGFVP